MRYWRTIHHQRWQAFLAALSGDSSANASKDAPLTDSSAPAVDPQQASADSPATDAPIDPLHKSEPELSTPLPYSESATEQATEAKADEQSEKSQTPESISTADPKTAPESAPAEGESIQEAAPSKRPSPDHRKGPSFDRNAVSAADFFAALGWVSGSPPSQLAPQDASDDDFEQDAETSHASPEARRPESGPSPEEATDPLHSSPESPATGREAPYAETARTAGPFFKTIPWDGRYAPGEALHSFSIEASQEDEDLDPRDADMPGNNPLMAGMRSAAKTSDKMAAAAHTKATEAPAGHYFRELPWSQN